MVRNVLDSENTTFNPCYESSEGIDSKLHEPVQLLYLWYSNLCMILWPVILPLQVLQFQFICGTNSSTVSSGDNTIWNGGDTNIWISTFLKNCRKYLSSVHISNLSFGHLMHIMDPGEECVRPGLSVGSLRTCSYF